MTVLLGRFGDNHVLPDTLFDRTDPAGRPPQDAVDVLFRSPVSLNLMLDAMAHAGREDLLRQWRDAYGELATETARFVQKAGYGTDQHEQVRIPARLAVTPVLHASVPGIDRARWHMHVYVGAQATSVRDGTRMPLDVDGLRDGVDRMSYPEHANRLEELVTELWGVRWGEPRPGAIKEIVDPPWHEHIDNPGRGHCPGPWGPRYLILADEQDLRLAAQTEQDLAQDAHGGRWSADDVADGDSRASTR